MKLPLEHGKVATPESRPRVGVSVRLPLEHGKVATRLPRGLRNIPCHVTA